MVPLTLDEVLNQHGIQSAAARSIGVGREQINSWLNGRSEPRSSNLVALTDFVRRYLPDVTEGDVHAFLEQRRLRYQEAAS